MIWQRLGQGAALIRCISRTANCSAEKPPGKLLRKRGAIWKILKQKELVKKEKSAKLYEQPEQQEEQKPTFNENMAKKFACYTECADSLQKIGKFSQPNLEVHSNKSSDAASEQATTKVLDNSDESKELPNQMQYQSYSECLANCDRNKQPLENTTVDRNVSSLQLPTPWITNTLTKELMMPVESTKLKQSLMIQQPQLPLENLSDLKSADGAIADATQHEDTQHIAQLMPVEKYATMMSNAQKFPKFLLPLQGDDNVRYMKLQFIGNTARFRTEDVGGTLVLTAEFSADEHFEDQMLVKATYDGTVLTAGQAEMLIEELQWFYCNNAEKTLELLATFRATPDKLNRDELLDEVLNELHPIK